MAIFRWTCFSNDVIVGMFERSIVILVAAFECSPAAAALADICPLLECNGAAQRELPGLAAEINTLQLAISPRLTEISHQPLFKSVFMISLSSDEGLVSTSCAIWALDSKARQPAFCDCRHWLEK